MVTEQDLNNAYSSASEARDTFYHATEDYEKAKLIYDGKSALAIYNGEIEGKNAEQRNAHALVLLESEASLKEESAAQLRQVKLDYDLAMLELGRVKALLRLMEVEASLAKTIIA